MIPGKTLLYVLGALTVVGVLYAVTDLGTLIAWPLLAYIAIGAALTDAVLLFRAPRLRAEREVAASLPLGVSSSAHVRIAMDVPRESRAAYLIRVWDHHPATFECDAFPLETAVVGASPTKIEYRLIPMRRGDHEFGPVEVRVRSPLGLWWRERRLTVESPTRVYPNFSPMTKYVHLGVDARLSMMGVRRLRRRGAGSDFHELRDYRNGDSMRQIDWRATARSRRLISRSYQDERDQRVVFMLDCGRRMRAADGEGLSHFDEALNAVLLLSYMALRQGDSVAMGTFGVGAEGRPRWMGAIKGPGRVNEVLNLLYDLEPSTQMPDYTHAATELLARHNKHALVVIVTNMRGEDASDILPAVRTLGRRHLVLVANLSEAVITQASQQDVRVFDDALLVAGAHQLLAEQARVVRQMRSEGVLVLDVKPAGLSAELLNTYLMLKASGSF